MTHKLLALNQAGVAPEGAYKSGLYRHVDEGGQTSDFIRLENPQGDAIWLGTFDGETYVHVDKGEFSHLETEYQRVYEGVEGAVQ